MCGKTCTQTRAGCRGRAPFLIRRGSARCNGDHPTFGSERSYVIEGISAGFSRRRARTFAESQETPPAPSDSGQPRARCADGRCGPVCAAPDEPVEPRGGRPSVDPVHDARPVLFRVHEDVDHRVPDGARRRELARVIALAPKPPANSNEAVHTPRDARSHALHPARERRRVRRLHDEVNVIRLDGKLQHAKRFARPARENAEHMRTERIFSQ